MLIALLRTVILYFCLIVFLRMMGKRQIGELQLTDLVVTLLIANLASIPMQTQDIPLLAGLVPMVTLVILEISMSYLTLKFPALHRLLSGTSFLLIDRGRINRRALATLRISLDDLLEELRTHQIAQIDEVEYAVLETNGRLSIFKKSEHRPLTAGQAGIPTPPATLPRPVISDGAADESAMRRIGIDRAWVDRYLRSQGVRSVSDVFLLNVDDNLQCCLIKKEDCL